MFPAPLHPVGEMTLISHIGFHFRKNLVDLPVELDYF